jgi:hypothetical protein
MAGGMVLVQHQRTSSGAVVLGGQGGMGKVRTVFICMCLCKYVWACLCVCVSVCMLCVLCVCVCVLVRFVQVRSDGTVRIGRYRPSFFKP